jgi:anti-anti-sigma factor
VSRCAGEVGERPAVGEAAKVAGEEDLDGDVVLLPDLAPLAPPPRDARDRPFQTNHGEGRSAMATRMLAALRRSTTSYNLEQRQTGDPAQVHVDATGELDLTNAHELEERLQELAAANGSVLVLDLNRVVFIDSAALHVLFRTARRLGRDRFRIVFEPTAAVARTLSIVNISEVATVSEAALDASSSSGA